MRIAVWLMAASIICAQDFTRDVQPIFERRCSACHGAGQQMMNLRLDDPQSAARVIVPGNAAASKLIERVTHSDRKLAMPPVGDRLTDLEISKIRAWIDGGAKWTAQTVMGKHWAFEPIRRPGSGNSIDAFVRARLKAEGLTPSPEADRTTLLRRLSLDLTGLPPAPAEISDFINDRRPDAYERLVDRLLASPHYGEKWARWWMDAAHYADSDGYEKDLVRPWAWRWRHWLIDTLNRDVPFDQFTIWQLAGDLLPNPTADQLIATGFLRNTLTNREAGVDRGEAHFEQLVNRTNTVATTWLGLTVGCAQCHNHKYDPISHREYYQLFSFFERAEEADIDAPLPGEIPPPPDYRQKRGAILAEYKIADYQARYEAKLREAFKTPGRDLEWDFMLTEFRAGCDGAEKLLRDDAARRSQRDADRMTDFFLRRNGPEFDADKKVSATLREARQKLTALAATLPRYSQAPAMRHDPDAPRTHIHVGGDAKMLGDAVDPGLPAVLPGPKSGQGALTRLDLAKWMVARENPLTARVAVNRVWQEYFGRGLVRTSEDFGTQGERPSHLELLDWLASEFIERGWSLKQLHRKIVTSATYKQSSMVTPELAQRDPENVLLARQSRIRLSAELIRDSALAASGLLNREIGGPSIRPAQPKGIAELGYGNSVKWNESPGADRYRRGLYIHYQRTTPYPQLANFDAPDSNVSCTRRRRSNTALQALNLLNDPVFFEAAQALGNRIERSGGMDRLDQAFQLTLGRRPTAGERQRLMAYVEKGGDWTGIARILLNLDEFVTRE
jgi:hypothetical protein